MAGPSISPRRQRHCWTLAVRPSCFQTDCSLMAFSVLSWHVCRTMTRMSKARKLSAAPSTFSAMNHQGVQDQPGSWKPQGVEGVLGKSSDSAWPWRCQASASADTNSSRRRASATRACSTFFISTVFERTSSTARLAATSVPAEPCIAASKSAVTVPRSSPLPRPRLDQAPLHSVSGSVSAFCSISLTASKLAASSSASTTSASSSASAESKASSAASFSSPPSRPLLPRPPSGVAAAANCSAMVTRNSCGTRSTNFAAMMAKPSSFFSAGRELHSSSNCFDSTSTFRSFTVCLMLSFVSDFSPRLAASTEDFGVGGLLGGRKEGRGAPTRAGTGLGGATAALPT
mmetsp:Transcript_53703/g.156544  ORF Transcript_53703/g.156544 Transcript_53703/m.156544 type:complete len:345 (-) Transcript_53703:383-1417(-)